MDSRFDQMQVPPEYRAQLEQMEKFQKQAQETEIALRRQAVAHAWLLCGCRPYWDRARPGTPAQAECVIHGTTMVTLEGEVL
jgi:hypothetical protein